MYKGKPKMVFALVWIPMLISPFHVAIVCPSMNPTTTTAHNNNHSTMAAMGRRRTSFHNATQGRGEVKDGESKRERERDHGLLHHVFV